MRNVLFILMLFLGAFLGSMSTAQAAAMPATPSATVMPITASLLASNSVVEYAYNGPRHMFMKPAKDAHEIANRIRAALAVNALGRSAIDGPNCGLACGTPEDLVDMLQQSDLRDIAPKDVNQLAAFVDLLEFQKTPPPGVYWMGCKGEDGSASAPAIFKCLARPFDKKTNEGCWAYKGICVFAYKCTNILGKEYHEEDCVRLLVKIPVAGAVLRGGPLAKPEYGAFPRGKCEYLVREPGSDERANPPTDKCPRETCTLERPAKFLGMQVLGPVFSFQAKTAGWAIIYLPKEVTQWDGVMELCMELPDGTQMDGKDMHKTAYHNGDAYVVMSATDVPAEWKGLPHIWRPDDGNYRRE